MLVIGRRSGRDAVGASRRVLPGGLEIASAGSTLNRPRRGSDSGPLCLPGLVVSLPALDRAAPLPGVLRLEHQPAPFADMLVPARRSVVPEVAHCVTQPEITRSVIGVVEMQRGWVVPHRLFASGTWVAWNVRGYRLGSGDLVWSTVAALRRRRSLPSSSMTAESPDLGGTCAAVLAGQLRSGTAASCAALKRSLTRRLRLRALGSTGPACGLADRKRFRAAPQQSAAISAWHVWSTWHGIP